MKKRYLLLLLVLPAMLMSCQAADSTCPQWDKFDTGVQGSKGDSGENAITYIPCIFNNYNGTKLYEFYYEKGTDIVYDGPTPTKTTTDEDGNTLNWTFVGWDKSLECIQKPTIFTAQFEYLYTCTFVNWDGSVLQTGKVNRGGVRRL